MASSTTGGQYYLFLVALSLLSSAAYGLLSPDDYATKCSSLDQIIKEQVDYTLFTDKSPSGGRRMGASLLRLVFHDCFVQGCDASVLLDDELPVIVSEKNANPNVNSLRGFDVINRIKAAVEKACPNVVSCADILSLVAKQAVIALGGQGWPLLLGRLDSTTANIVLANTDLPSPNSNLDTLLLAFGRKGFNARELVALSGAHTIGLAQCGNIDQTQQPKCSNVLPLDAQTPESFDNLYYGNLPSNGLLHSDRVLVDRTDLKDLVGQYASNQTLFFEDFGKAMTKMSEMSVLTEPFGEVRRNCSRVNKNY